nr:MAG TPA: hypothetical protein [Caudoviricetes sp.]
MERLTIPDVRVDDHTTCRTMIDAEAVREHAMDFYWRLKAYEETGLSPQACAEAREAGKVLSSCDISFRRLAELLTADKAGRLVVQPCKVGDTLFRVFAGEILEHKVRNMRYLAIQGRWDIDTTPFCSYVESSIGKTIFLTHEQAERALEAKSNA